jgi:uncharacterized protein
MEAKEQIISLTNLVREHHANDTTGHDWWHIWRVWQLAKHIAIKEGANLFLVEVAALLHDVDDWKLNDSSGSEVEHMNAQTLMIGNGFDDIFIEKVINTIEEVSFKGAGVNTTPTHLEACVVQDADRIDAIGAIGIARAFAYGGSKNRPIWDPSAEPVLHSSYGEYRNSKGNTINHFYEKLLLLMAKLNTKTAKEIAAQRHTFMEQFLTQFYYEWDINNHLPNNLNLPR